MNRTKIEYGTHAWNPVTGCSYGCPWGCWAEAIASRFTQIHSTPSTLGFKSRVQADFRTVLHHHDRLDEPLQQKKPARVLVGFMSDLFGPEVDPAFFWRVIGTMHSARQHQYFLLTKRAERLKETIGIYQEKWLAQFSDAWPREYAHVLLGVTVTTQAEADERIPLLLATPAAKRWISAEPLLGPLDLSAFMGVTPNITGDRAVQFSMLDFVVCGSIDRPSPQFPAPRREWIESIREQCQAAGVPLWEKNNLARHGIVKDRPLVQELPSRPHRSQPP